MFNGFAFYGQKRLVYFIAPLQELVWKGVGLGFILAFLLCKVPWKSRVLARAQFEFTQQVTLKTCNILTPRCPWPRTLTNHIGVSDVGGPKALLFYRPDTARVLSIG